MSKNEKLMENTFCFKQLKTAQRLMMFLRNKKTFIL